MTNFLLQVFLGLHLASFALAQSDLEPDSEAETDALATPQKTKVMQRDVTPQDPVVDAEEEEKADQVDPGKGEILPKDDFKVSVKPPSTKNAAPISLIINLDASVFGAMSYERRWRRRWLMTCRALSRALNQGFSQVGDPLRIAEECEIAGERLRGSDSLSSLTLNILRVNRKLKINFSDEQPAEAQKKLLFEFQTQATDKPLVLLISRGFVKRLSGQLRGALSSSSKKSLATQVESSADTETPALQTGSHASGFVSVRYGTPLLAEGLFVAKATAVDIQAEMRDGPLGGLVLSYMLVPKVTESLGELDLDYQAKRAFVGWSVGWGFAGLVSRFDVSAMLGLWSYDFSLPTQKDDLSQGKSRYQLLDRPTLGLRSGLESEGSFWLLRPWLGVDQTLSFLQVEDRVSYISSLRMGFDFVLKGPYLGFADLDAYLFTTQDRVTLSQQQRKRSGEQAQSLLRRVSYTHFVAGLGLALTW